MRLHPFESRPSEQYFLLGLLWTLLVGAFLLLDHPLDGNPTALLGSVSRGLAEPFNRQVLGHALLWTLGLGLILAARRSATSRDKELELLNGRLALALQATELVVEKVPFGVVIIGRDRRIRSANRTALEIMGCHEDEVVGNHCSRHFCSGESGRCPIMDLNQIVDHAERKVLVVGGEEIPVMKSVLPITWRGEEVLLEAFIDISDRKEAEAALRRMVEDEQRFNRLATGRELRMIELKAEVNRLLEETGRGPRYRPADASAVGERG